ncbi:MAG: response regulator, partial [Pedobacter sp.]
SSQVDPSIPDTLIGDATRLTQILVNLIGNAIKFTQQGNVNIEVYNKEQLDGKITVGFKVSDTGIGIDKEKLTEVFERFNQGEDSITRNYGGTGLGLSIVKNLILLQHGNIEVSSEQGKGTTFNFYIPYGISAEQIQNVPALDVNHFKDKNNMPWRVLVVDDNAINQSLMKHLLLQWNVDFDIVANGLEAVNRLREHVYDLILMDIQMPQMDGYTATQQIREVLQLDTPIIAMTAHAMAGEREKCLSRGMNDYISKPIKEEELFKLISSFGLQEHPQQTVENVTVENSFKFIDLDYMRSISGGDVDFEKTVTQQFITNVPKHLQQLKTAYQNNDFATVNMRAHDFKTSIAMLGLLNILAEKLDSIELVSEQNKVTEQIIKDLEYVLMQAVAEAKIFLQQL